MTPTEFQILDRILGVGFRQTSRRPRMNQPALLGYFERARPFMAHDSVLVGPSELSFCVFARHHVFELTVEGAIVGTRNPTQVYVFSLVQLTEEKGFFRRAYSESSIDFIDGLISLAVILNGIEANGF
jgi:hypothetical protein